MLPAPWGAPISARADTAVRRPCERHALGEFPNFYLPCQSLVENQMAGLQRALRSLSTVREWRNTDKCALAGLVVLPFTIWYAVFASYLLTHVDYAPYVYRPFVEVPLRIHLWVDIPAWVAIVVVALAFRDRPAVNRVLPYVLCWLYFVW